MSDDSKGWSAAFGGFVLGAFVFFQLGATLGAHSVRSEMDPQLDEAAKATVRISETASEFKAKYELCQDEAIERQTMLADIAAELHFCIERAKRTKP